MSDEQMVAWLRSYAKLAVYLSEEEMINAIADRIEALQADNAKLHNRLRNIRALATRQLYERGPNGTLADIEQFATAALQETER